MKFFNKLDCGLIFKKDRGLGVKCSELTLDRGFNIKREQGPDCKNAKTIELG